jgi:hypothetical protein
LQFERSRIVNEIRLAQPHIQYAPARQYRSQTLYDGFDFR